MDQSCLPKCGHPLWMTPRGGRGGDIRPPICQPCQRAISTQECTQGHTPFSSMLTKVAEMVFHKVVGRFSLRDTVATYCPGRPSMLKQNAISLHTRAPRVFLSDKNGILFNGCLQFISFVGSWPLARLKRIFRQIASMFGDRRRNRSHDGP